MTLYSTSSQFQPIASTSVCVSCRAGPTREFCYRRTPRARPSPFRPWVLPGRRPWSTPGRRATTIFAAGN